MTGKKLYLILQSILCVMLVILLAFSAVSIYREGRERRAEDPTAPIYTPEKTAAKISPIIPLFFGAIGMTAAGWILAVKDENADKPVRDAELARNLIVSRVAVPSEQMLEEQRRQRKVLRGGWALFTLCMLPAAVYLLNGAHFALDDLEEMFAQLCLHVVPWAILSLGCLMLTSILLEKSILRETAAAREQIEKEKRAGVRPEPKLPRVKNDKAKRVFRLAVIAAAVVFILLGDERQRESRTYQSRKYLYGVYWPWIT